MEFVIFAFLAVQLDYCNIQIRPAQYTIRNYWNRVGHQYSIQIYAFSEGYLQKNTGWEERQFFPVVET